MRSIANSASSPRSASRAFRSRSAYALCTDDAVIGSAFYIMSMEEGRVFWDPTLPSQTPDARRKIFTSKIETLAKLHSYDPEKIGLGDFGKPGNYFARQVDRWTKQYRASETQHIPEFEKLAEWLPKTVPQQERVSIVHGDYRLDNMIFHPTEPRVLAVLDWELSTLGDPMADFTYLLMQWTMPGSRQRRPQGAEHSEPWTRRRRSIATSPARPCPTSTGISPTICSVSPASPRASPAVSATAPRPTPRPSKSAKRTVPLSQASWEYAQKAGAV